jgi:hypothetical protein
MDQPDFSDDPSSRKTLVNITTYKDSLDIFISFKFIVEAIARESMLDSITKEPMLDSVAKDPMLDWAAYQDAKLDTCWSLLRTRDMLQPLRGFLPVLGFSSISFFLLHPQIFKSFHLRDRGVVRQICLWITAQRC